MPARDLLVRQRTQLINAIRGHLTEYGWIAPKGPSHVAMLADLLEEEEMASSLPEAARAMFRLMLDLQSTPPPSGPAPAGDGVPMSPLRRPRHQKARGQANACARIERDNRQICAAKRAARKYRAANSRSARSASKHGVAD